MKRGEPLRSDPETTRAFLERGRKSSAESLSRSRKPLGRGDARSKRPGGRGFEASPAQRRKVKEAPAVLVAFDGRVGLVRETAEPVDPMHLVPRSKGGCDHPDCVIAAARFSVHRPYDDGTLDLCSFFAEDANRLAFLPELQHALEHLSIVELAQQLANDKVVWVSSGVPARACGEGGL